MTVATNDSTSPRLSVVFAVRNRLSSIQKTLECLLVQTAAPRIELIVSADSQELLADTERFVVPRSRFGNCRFLLHPTPELARARARSVVEATGDLVVFSEDHGFPEPTWAEELLAAFDSSADVLAAAPVLRNPNPASAVSRAQFLLFHTARQAGASRLRFEEADFLPWHSTAYRRALLLDTGPDEEMFRAEGCLQSVIRARHPGASFVRCTRSTVEHVNMSRVSSALSHAFHGGRLFANARAKLNRWGPGARVARSTAFPLVALVKLVRSVASLHDRRSMTKTLANVAAAVPLTLAYALGESWGVCLGAGRSPAIYADLETNRARLVRPSDRHLLFSRGDPGPHGAIPVAGGRVSNETR